IAASGLVLTYATTGVFNFAHGAVGMVSAYVFYALTVQHGLPTMLGVLIVLAVFAPLVGIATERVMRSFRDASVQTSVVGAIALGVMKQHATFALPPGDAWQSVKLAVPGIFLFAALLLVPAAKLSVGRIVGAKTPKVPSLPSSVVRGTLFVVAMVVVANLAPSARLFDITTGLIYGLLLLSLVLLTGYSGQISLCQYVFMAI